VSCFTNNAWTVTRSLHYAWQGWKLAAECERDGAGTITAVRHFVWGPDIAGQQSASLESGAEGIGGLLLIREWKLGRGMKQYLPLTDGLGSVCGLIDATDGSLAAEYDYDPYGGPVIERGIAADACPFRHRTRYYDSESWLYYYGYRYYDPSTTKWISKDPLGEAGGWNLTCFCGNDPVNGYDPLGLEAYLVAADCSIGGRLRSWRNQVNADIFLSNYDLYEDEKNGELSRFGVSLARHIRRIPEGIKMSVVDTISSTYDRVTSDPIEAMTDPMGVKTGPKKAWNAISGVEGTVKSAFENPSNQNIDNAIFIAEDLILLGYGAKQGYNSFNAPKPVALKPSGVVKSSASQLGVESVADETVTLYHGTTTSAGRRIVNGEFRAGVDNAVFFGEDFSTARFFGEARIAETGASSGQVLRFNMPRSLAKDLGLTSRQVLGEYRGAPPIDIPGSTGYEMLLMGDKVGLFNQAVRSGQISVKQTRIGF